MAESGIVGDIVDLSGAELELLLSVAGDLEFLRTATTDRLPSHAEVRAISGVLRRLLVEGALKSLWGRVRADRSVVLSVFAPDLDAALSTWRPEWVRYAYSGGRLAGNAAGFAGLIYGAVPGDVIGEYASPDDFLKSDRAPQVRPSGVLMSVDKFMHGTAVALNFTPGGLLTFTREAVLKYVANRRGGVHFDGRRGPDLHLSKNRSGKGSKADRESFYLDHNFVRVGHLNGAEFEVASMAQLLSNTPWARELVEIAANLAPEDFDGDPNELKFWQVDTSEWATARIDAGGSVSEQPNAAQ